MKIIKKSIDVIAWIYVIACAFIIVPISPLIYIFGQAFDRVIPPEQSGGIRMPNIGG